VYISGIWGQNPLGGLSPNFLEDDIPDVITCFKFGDDRLRGLACEHVITWLTNLYYQLRIRWVYRRYLWDPCF